MNVFDRIRAAALAVDAREHEHRPARCGVGLVEHRVAGAHRLDGPEHAALVARAVEVEATRAAGAVGREENRAVNTDGTLTYSFVESVLAMHPFYIIRFLGGAVFLAGTFVMAYNLSYAARLSELAPFSTETLALWTVVTIRWPELANWMRLRIADGTLEPRQEERDDRSHPCHLLDRPEVLRVLDAVDRGGPLNEETLPRYCGIFEQSRRAVASSDRDTDVADTSAEVAGDDGPTELRSTGS